MSSDSVNRPKHYTSDPSGVECITIARHRTFNIGNAMKYLWRSGLKVAEGRETESQAEDLNKALYYIFDELHRLGAPVTCRHARMVQAVLSDAATASSVTTIPAAPKRKPAAPDEPYTMPEWVRLEDSTDDEPQFCSACRCQWWARVNANVVKCAKCALNNINLKGGGFDIVARMMTKPEL